MSAIEVAVTRRQGRFSLHADFTAPFEGVTGLVGPSGAGKSTLFSCIAGLTRPDAGRIRIGGITLFDADSGVNLPAARRGVGVVFQDGLLFPHLSVRANLLYGAPRPNPRLFAQVVGVLGLDPLLRRRPGRLSGGERQRVALGRALMSEPRLLLLDEPLSALDPAMKAEGLALLEAVRDATATPMLYISHAPEEIRRLADRVVTLRDGAVAPAPEGFAPGRRAGPVPELALAP